MFLLAGRKDASVAPKGVRNLAEVSVEFIEDDDLVEVTPKAIRVRKRHLLEHERKRAKSKSSVEATA